MELTAFGMTDVGRMRPHNEDAILLEPLLQLYAVADGMGGHKGGEIASKIVLESMKDYLLRATTGNTPQVGELIPDKSAAANILASAVCFANRAVFEASFSEPAWRGMGTTIVAIQFTGNSCVIAHVGDSRAYLLRDEKLCQLTQDHSWVEEQVRAGFMTRDEALFAKGRNVLTRAIGQDASVTVEIDELVIKQGDKILLCSDGLYSMISDEETAAILLTASTPESGCSELISYANSRGGRDNISVILVESKAQNGLFAGMKKLFYGNV